MVSQCAFSPGTFPSRTFSLGMPILGDCVCGMLKEGKFKFLVSVCAVPVYFISVSLSRKA